MRRPESSKKQTCRSKIGRNKQDEKWPRIVLLGRGGAPVELCFFLSLPLLLFLLLDNAQSAGWWEVSKTAKVILRDRAIRCEAVADIA
jgi:hypothetical protein